MPKPEPGHDPAWNEEAIGTGHRVGDQEADADDRDDGLGADAGELHEGQV